MSGDTLVWFLAGLGVGIAVAMLAFLVLSALDRRALSRQRRQREARASDLPPVPLAPQAVRLSPTAASPTNRGSERTLRNAQRQPERASGQVAAISHDHEPDFGFLEPASNTMNTARREPELVFDLTDLPEVATPAVVDAYVPSFDQPAPRPQSTVAAVEQVPDSPTEPSLRGPELAQVSREREDITETVSTEPATRPVSDVPQRPEIRRPAPPPKPLPAAARQKAQATTQPPAPSKGPAPVSIAPLRSAAARVSGDGSKPPANFRPLLPKADGASRPARPVQRRPFTEITIPFEGPATLVPTPEDAAPEPSAVEVKPVADAAVAVPPAPATRLPEPVPEPVATEVETVPEVSEALPASAPGLDEAALDSAAAQSIEQGSGIVTSGRAPQQKVEKPLPKMPPPRLTPDTVEAIFAEAFARGSAEPPDRKS